MGVIDFNSFMAFRKGLEGENLPTVGGMARFILESVRNERLIYIPTSTRVPRRQTRRRVELVLHRYMVTQSLNTGDYTDITPNASYILALIKLYLARQPK